MNEENPFLQPKGGLSDSGYLEKSTGGFHYTKRGRKMGRNQTDSKRQKQEFLNRLVEVHPSKYMRVQNNSGPYDLDACMSSLPTLLRLAHLALIIGPTPSTGLPPCHTKSISQTSEKPSKLPSVPDFTIHGTNSG